MKINFDVLVQILKILIQFFGCIANVIETNLENNKELS